MNCDVGTRDLKDLRSLIGLADEVICELDQPPGPRGAQARAALSRAQAIIAAHLPADPNGEEQSDE